MKNFRFVFFSVLICLFSGNIISQVSVGALKSAGINSEQDLKKLGVSSAEIERAKAEFFGGEESVSATSGDLKGEVDTETKKDELKEISVPVVNLKSSQLVDDENVYGHSIFRNGSVNIIKNSDRVKAPESYRLVAGDKINITIWGYSEFSGEFIVGELGNITPKLVGRINLKGKTFSTAREIVTSKFGRVYDLKNSQIAIDLSYSQVISVNVIGEVQKPGSYSVPSLNSAFNILALAGGPTELGSIRSIEIRRDGKLVRELDVYEFMFAPKSFENQYLQDGDFIVVNPMQGTVEAKGELKRPTLYEFKQGDKYSDLLRFSGGYSAMANTSNINITRVHNNQLQLFSIEELLAGQKDFLLKNGDEIEVLKVSNLVRNSVSIKGAVHIPGFYPFTAGTKISDLISSSKGLTYKAFTGIGHLYRLTEDLSYEIKSFQLGKVISSTSSTDDLILQEFDQIIIFNKDSFLNKESVAVSGMVNAPGSYDFREGMTLEDLILLSNGAKLEADLNKIEIERVGYKAKTDEGGYIEIFSLTYPNDKGFKLSAFDKISFRKLTGFNYQQTIEIRGEVKFPGKYSLTGNNDKISDLIARAGGTTQWAYLENAVVTRIDGGLGLLLLNLEKVLSDEDSKFNYVLKPGDYITIPKISNVVTIKGAIGFKFVNGTDERINSPFHKGKRAGYYIRKYGGGYDKYAKKNKIYVIGINGLVRKGTFFGWIKPKVRRGDEIIVNYKPKKATKEKGDRIIDWNKTIESMTIKITGIATFWIVLQRIDLS